MGDDESDASSRMDVDFYLYFPTREAAEAAAEELRAERFTVEVRRSADDVNWLALANKSMTVEEFEDAEESRMPELAEALGGEYDGYERGVSGSR